MDDKEFNKIVKRLYELCIESQELDVMSMLVKFKKAQWLIIDTITKIEGIGKSHGKSNDTNQLNKETRQILTLKDFANSIAWIMVGATTSSLRAYYGSGGDFGHLSSKNIATSLKVIREFEEKEDVFILLTDVTTAVNVGDLLILKLGKPPLTIEMKEGEKNAQLLTLLHDDSLLNKHLDSLTAKERKTTERHIQRLRNQQKRLDTLMEYLKDHSRRYDEYLGTHIQVVEQTLKERTYKLSIQNAYDRMDERIKTLKFSGGLSVLIAKSPYNTDDVLYFKHTVYHRMNHHRKTQCVIQNQQLGADSVEKEMNGIMNLGVSSWLQDIGKPGNIPLTTALQGFSKKLAIGLLTCKVTLYIYVDVGPFIGCLRKAGIQVQLRKPLGGSHQANALVVYENKNVVLNGIARLTLAFHDRIVLNFSHPLHEVALQKELTGRVAALTKDELESMLISGTAHKS